MNVYMEGNADAGQWTSIELDPHDSDAVARTAIEAYRLVIRWAAEDVAG